MRVVPHGYRVGVRWTGARDVGTATYRSYSRRHTVTSGDLPPILGSADRTFHGDADRWNPEQLFLAAIAECHMLSYLHLATKAGLIVVAYEDEATGELRLDADGVGGQFTSVTLHPVVTLAAGPDDEAATETARALHDRVGDVCFIARSVSVPIVHEVTIRRA